MQDFSERQRQELADQDAILDRLGQAMERTKNVALNIEGELVEHDTLLTRIDHSVGRATDEVISQNRTVGQLLRSTDNSQFWKIVAFLLLVIVVLSVVALKT
jgi:hypothetical protein